MRYIYCITNLINGKQYIGQTGNPKQRWRDHRTKPRASAISAAILKYGQENFEFKVIEKVDRASEREIELIEEYNTLAPNGYNITPGGEGRSLTEEERTHPLEKIRQIVDFLEFTDFSQVEIAELFEVCGSIVTMANRGESSYFLPEVDIYPIREGRVSRRTIEKIQNFLIEGKSQREIAEKFCFGLNFVNRINRGEIFRNEALRYPLSPYTHRQTTKKKVKAIEKELAKRPDISYDEIDGKFAIKEKDFILIKKGEHRYSSEACRD